eukprot:TRINITY_DN19766_c0_g1_i1.p1 TRINITY_DN19766_c0_g1~~TRINITY_DN19766_c0_g1_i1.p1  ORF type:complete len:282 (+),score=54.44 TRINITY_DN19766_c0_g1_i1:83-928(+)
MTSYDEDISISKHPKLTPQQLQSYTYPKIGWSELVGSPNLLLPLIQKHCFVLITIDPEQQATLRQTIQECTRFFESQGKNPTLSGECCPLSCWTLGFSDQFPVREMYHYCSGASAIHPEWPSPHFKSLYLQSFQLLEKICKHSLEIIAGPQTLQAWLQSGQKDGDPSILDCFYYLNNQLNLLPKEGENLKCHLDPGLFTLKVASAEPGLELFDPSVEKWVDIELVSKSENCDLLLFPGEALQNSRIGHNLKITGSYHRVRTATQSRLSLVYEMRTHLPQFK